MKMMHLDKHLVEPSIKSVFIQTSDFLAALRHEEQRSPGNMFRKCVRKWAHVWIQQEMFSASGWVSMNLTSDGPETGRIQISQDEEEV